MTGRFPSVSGRVVQARLATWSRRGVVELLQEADSMVYGDRVAGSGRTRHVVSRRRRRHEDMVGCW
jgi:hypothetical protein